MPEPQYRRWRAHAVITNAGLPVVVLELPECNYVLGRDEALMLGLTLTTVAMRVFPSAGEFCDALRKALDAVDPPPPIPEETPQPPRPNGSRRRRPPDPPDRPA